MYSHKRTVSLLSLCLLLICTAIFNTNAAIPVISIDGMFNILPNNEDALIKRVYNSGENTAFVRVDVVEVTIENGKVIKEQVIEKLNNGELNKNSLVVTPARLIIPPASFMQVRLIWPGDRSEERYFRVRFTPVIPDSNNSFGLKEEEIKEYKNKTVNAGVNVLSGYGSILFIQPKNLVFNTDITNESNYVQVTNNGNSTVILENIRHCAVNSNECSTSTQEYLLPKRTVKLDKELAKNLSFTLIEGNKKSNQQF